MKKSARKKSLTIPKLRTMKRGVSRPVSFSNVESTRRYFFALQHGGELIVDDEGIDLPNLEAVHREAVRTLADMARALNRFPAPMMVEVRDATGSVLRARGSFDLDRTN